jgi:tricorn protease
MSDAYLQNPSIHNKWLTFLSDEDLWLVEIPPNYRKSDSAQLQARRLTSSKGVVTNGVMSPDGQWLAYAADEQGGREIFVMPAQGGPSTRLTFGHWGTWVVGWRKSQIVFSTQALTGNWESTLAVISKSGGEVTDLRFGPCHRETSSESGWHVLERNSFRPDPAHWKRYRGGTAGKFYAKSPKDKKYFRILDSLSGNLSCPMLINERLYFLSDHDNWGNLYSVKLAELDSQNPSMEQHTFYRDYYARNAHTDGRRIVFHHGAEIGLFDPSLGLVHKLPIHLGIQKSQRQKKLIGIQTHLESYFPSNDGSRVVITTRGQVMSIKPWLGPWYSPPKIENKPERQRLGMPMGKEDLIFISDASGEETFILHKRDSKKGSLESKKFTLPSIQKEALGIVRRVKISPDEKHLLIATHRNQLFLYSIPKSKLKLVYSADQGPLGDFAFAHDNQTFAYLKQASRHQSFICAESVTGSETLILSEPHSGITSLSFSPCGNFLGFLVALNFDPRYESLRFQLYFPTLLRPIILRLNQESPSFVDAPLIAKKESLGQKSKKTTTSKNKIVITTDKIFSRWEALPVEDKSYLELFLVNDGVLLLGLDPKGARNSNWTDRSSERLFLDKWSPQSRSQKTISKNLDGISFSPNFQWTVIEQKNTLRIRKVGEIEIDDKTESGPNPKSGIIDLSQQKLCIDPKVEWQQILREAWRLQREFFWESNLGGVNWKAQLPKYERLLPKVSCRSELTDLLWELIGELGVSHAYAMGGDQAPPIAAQLGSLGVEVKWSPKVKGYEIIKIMKGYPWRDLERSPLSAWADLGDSIKAIDGVNLEDGKGIPQTLWGKANSEVLVTLQKKGKRVSEFKVLTLPGEHEIRYRDWVETCRTTVDKLSKGKLGYLHIPDMGPVGYGEFFEQYQKEFEKDGLIVDARYNGGGHVSQLLLTQLMQKRLGFDYSRYFGVQPYFESAVAGPIIALTNEFAGSDGDIFPHAFKMLNLGPLIGNRTWGGVIGIWPRHRLVDGGIVTSPEFSFWFKDVGFSVEGYGTDPTLPLDNLPHDYLAGHDAQLIKGIEEGLRMIKQTPPLRALSGLKFPSRKV